MSVNIGNSVQILTSQGSIDPNIYIVNYVKGTQVGLTNQATGIQTKVHSSRIHGTLGEIEMDNIVTTETITTDETETPKIKIKRTRTPKTPTALVDFNALVADGYEPWVKGGLSLGSDNKVKDIRVAAACLIDTQGRLDNEGLENGLDQSRSGFEIFNLYNGTRGKKSKRGKFFPFTEKNTIEKKRKSLEKNGYTCLGNISLDEVLEEDDMDIPDSTDILDEEFAEATN
jgi:hypothetical protein